jgi:hypothetical protein
VVRVVDACAGPRSVAPDVASLIEDVTCHGKVCVAGHVVVLILHHFVKDFVHVTAGTEEGGEVEPVLATEPPPGWLVSQLEHRNKELTGQCAATRWPPWLAHELQARELQLQPWAYELKQDQELVQVKACEIPAIQP